MAKVGINSKFYYGTAGSVPVSTLVGGIEDVSFGGAGSTAESTDRNSTSTQRLMATGEWSVTVKMTEIPDDTGQVAMLAAFIAGTKLAYNILDGTGGKGGSGDGIISSWKVSRPLAGPVKIEMKIDSDGAFTFN